MNEKELIKNLRKMKEVRPEKDWVFLNKRAILGEELPHSIISEIRDIFSGFVLVHKFASVVLLLVASFSGTAIYAQNALPGDVLYGVKKTTEKVHLAFKSGDQIALNFEVAQRRLDDLDRVVRTNSSKNLAPAINEFQETVSEASKSVKVAEIKDVEKVSERIDKIEEKKELIKSYGIQIEENKDLNNLKEGIFCKKTGDLLEFTETRTLTEKQALLFTEAKELFKNGKCQEAEEKVLVDLEELEEIDVEGEEGVEDDIEENKGEETEETTEEIIEEEKVEEIEIQ